MSDDSIPTEISLPDPSTLVIEWSDGETRAYQLEQLQEQCPCAGCREKRRQEAQAPAKLLPVISGDEAKPLQLIGMTPVGRYAYSLMFNRGCNQGIWTLENLRQLGKPQ